MADLMRASEGGLLNMPGSSMNSVYALTTNLTIPPPLAGPVDDPEQVKGH